MLTETAPGDGADIPAEGTFAEGRIMTPVPLARRPPPSVAEKHHGQTIQA